MWMVVDVQSPSVLVYSRFIGESDYSVFATSLERSA